MARDRELCGCETVEVVSFGTRPERMIDHSCGDKAHLLGRIWPGAVRWVDGSIKGIYRGYAESMRRTKEAWAREVFGAGLEMDGCILGDVTIENTDVRHATTPKATDSATHNATVTFPYGFTLPSPSASNKQEELKDAEDKVLAAIENWPKWQRAICYRQLHALGLRMTDVDDLIRRRAK